MSGIPQTSGWVRDTLLRSVPTVIAIIVATVASWYATALEVGAMREQIRTAITSMGNLATEVASTRDGLSILRATIAERNGQLLNYFGTEWPAVLRRIERLEDATYGRKP